MRPTDLMRMRPTDPTRRHPPRTHPLGDALDAVVSLRLPGRTIDRVDRRPAPYRSSRWLEHVTLHLDDGTVIPLVYKDFLRAVPGSDADRVKPADVADPAREVRVYRQVLENGTTRKSFEGSRPPRAWGIVPGRGGRPRGLLLERIEGVPLAEVGDLAAWRTAAAWLAHFHASPFPHRDDALSLLAHDHRLHERWLERAEHVGALGGLEPGERDRLHAAHGRAVDLVFSTPPVLLHGEFYPSNVVTRRGRGRWTVHPVDWEMSGPGPAILDLAALTSGGWDRGDRGAIADAWLDASEVSGGPYGGASRSTFFRHLVAGRLLLAVQWLGWADAAWTPPPTHRTNWLRTALDCAEELS